MLCRASDHHVLWLPDVFLWPKGEVIKVTLGLYSGWPVALIMSEQLCRARHVAGTPKSLLSWRKSERHSLQGYKLGRQKVLG